MYATVRRYEGVMDRAEAGRRVSEGFVPLISEIGGFITAATERRWTVSHLHPEHQRLVAHTMIR